MTAAELEREEHYRRGYRRAWIPGRADLGAEESRVEARFGRDAAAAFADGWIDAVCER